MSSACHSPFPCFCFISSLLAPPFPLKHTHLIHPQSFQYQHMSSHHLIYNHHAPYTQTENNTRPRAENQDVNVSCLFSYLHPFLYCCNQFGTITLHLTFKKAPGVAAHLLKLGIHRSKLGLRSHIHHHIW